MGAVFVVEQTVQRDSGKMQAFKPKSMARAVALCVFFSLGFEHIFHGTSKVDAYSSDRPFITLEQMALFDAIERDTARKYGSKIKAYGVSNVDYKVRYGKLSSSQTMNPPPSCGRIFSGYLVVRKLGTPDQYETWMPDHVFEELYRDRK